MFLSTKKTSKTGLAPPTGESVTQIGDRLCVSADEEAFVEALIVHVTHKRIDLQEQRIMMVDDQIRQIAVERRGDGWRTWDNKQMARLKRKYICTLTAGASRFELLRMIQRGRPGANLSPGVPSEYEATGIEDLLKPDVKWFAGRRSA